MAKDRIWYCYSRFSSAEELFLTFYKLRSRGLSIFSLLDTASLILSPKPYDHSFPFELMRGITESHVLSCESSLLVLHM